jgi:hypothetical protein
VDNGNVMLPLLATNCFFLIVFLPVDIVTRFILFPGKLRTLLWRYFSVCLHACLVFLDLHLLLFETVRFLRRQLTAFDALAYALLLPNLSLMNAWRFVLLLMRERKIQSDTQNHQHRDHSLHAYPSLNDFRVILDCGLNDKTDFGLFLLSGARLKRIHDSGFLLVECHWNIIAFIALQSHIDTGKASLNIPSVPPASEQWSTGQHRYSEVVEGLWL